MAVHMIFLLPTACALISLSSSLTSSTESNLFKVNGPKADIDKLHKRVTQHNIMLLQRLSENEKDDEDPHHLKDIASAEETSTPSEESRSVRRSSPNEAVGNVEHDPETSAPEDEKIVPRLNVSKLWEITGGQSPIRNEELPAEIADDSIVDRSNWTRKPGSLIDSTREADRDSTGATRPTTEEISSGGYENEERQSLKSTYTTCPCRLLHDSVYGGDLVQCSSLGLDHVNPNCLSSRSTTLILRSNKLARLGNGTFACAPNLRSLDLSANNLIALDIETFSGVSRLEEMSLEENQLDLSDSLWPSIFEYTPRLRQLNLGFNGNEQKLHNKYPSQMFKGLKNLRILILDTFAGDLEFDDIFLGLNKLNALTLTGGVYNIRNESFSSFNDIPLDTLILRHLKELRYTEEAAYQPLKKLQSFHVFGVRQAIEATLRSLYPFAHRSMKSLVFNNIGKNEFDPRGIMYKDGIIDHHKAQYLSTICLENFELSFSWVFVIDSGTLTSHTWARCLKYFSLTNLQITGDRISYIQALQMTSLVVVNFRGTQLRQWTGCLESSNCLAGACANSMQRRGTGSRRQKTERKLSGADPSMDGAKSYTTEKRLPHHNYVSSKLMRDSYIMNNVNTSSDINKKHSLSSKNNFGVSMTAGFVTIKISETLQIINLEKFSFRRGRLDYNLMVEGASKLRAIYDGGNGVEHFTGNILGLSKLEIYDMSYNDASVLSPAFFDPFPGLKYLNMKHTLLVSSFMLFNSARLFRNLTNLRCLNLADNSLSSLSDNVFSTNPQMIRLDLSRNRFHSIPFNIGLLPRLSFLDMSFNSISHLSKSQTDSLDAHVENSGNFTLLLQGNILSCSCSNLQFLSWLSQTNVMLDSSRNYTCVTETGDVSNTLFRRDILALWRVCNGRFYFLVSLILASLTAVVFLSVTLYIRLKTTVLSFFFQMSLPEFRLHSPQDFRYGVFIAYSDVDSLFACLTLRQYLENELGLTTFVKDRNILPGSDMAEAIVDAVHSSWRVIILVTPALLREDDWAYFTMKTATYAVNPRNPRLLVALVEDRVKHAIPLCLLRAVNEANLVSLSDPEHLGYEQR